MIDQEFVPGTVIASAWLNGINDAVKDMHGQESFNLYVSTIGSDSNDGLSAEYPFATLQKAFDTLMAIGVVGGSRTINIAAGTYSSVGARRAVLGPGEESEVDANLDTYKTNGVLAVNHIIIQGPDVGYDPATNPWPTPTAIFDGGSASLTGLKLEGRGVKVLVKNIKFINYAGASAAGISSDGCFLRTENCHFSGCTYGIEAQKGSLEVSGGDFYGTAGKVGTGIRSIFKNYHNIGSPNAVDATQGPRMRFLNIGFHAQEGGTGHSDGVLYEDCVYGINATVNARINYAHSNFKRCTCAVRAEYNGVVVGSNTAVFNEGTADANDEIFWIYGGARNVDRGYLQTEQSSFEFPNYGQMPQTITGTTSAINVISTTLPMGWYAPQTVYTTRSPIIFKLRAAGTMPAGVDTRQFEFRLGTTLNAGVTVDAAVNGDWVFDGLITLHDYNQQSASCVFNAHVSGGSKQTWVDVDTGTEDTKTTDTLLRFKVQLSNAADSVTVNYCHFEILG